MQFSIKSLGIYSRCLQLKKLLAIDQLYTAIAWFVGCLGRGACTVHFISARKESNVKMIKSSYKLTVQICILCGGLKHISNIFGVNLRPAFAAWGNKESFFFLIMFSWLILQMWLIHQSSANRPATQFYHASFFLTGVPFFCTCG